MSSIYIYSCLQLKLIKTNLEKQEIEKIDEKGFSGVCVGVYAPH
jgi:hypothetical protein